MRSRPYTRLGRVALALLVLLIALGATILVVTRGGVETVGTLSNAPAWAASCRGKTPRPDRRLLAPCSRAHGLVLWVRHKGPAAHPTEVHFAMQAGIHPLIVKLGDPELQEAPGVAHRVTVVGALVRASNGMREIQAWAIW